MNFKDANMLGHNGPNTKANNNPHDEQIDPNPKIKVSK